MCRILNATMSMSKEDYIEYLINDMGYSREDAEFTAKMMQLED